MKRGVPFVSIVVLFLFFLIPNASALTNVTGCQTLSSENETYVFNTSITDSVDTCFLFSANNIVLDCDGYSINMTTGGSTVFNLQNYNNLTVKNCNAHAKNCSGVNKIFANSDVTNSTFINNSIHVCGEGWSGVDGEKNLEILDSYFELRHSYSAHPYTSTTSSIKGLNVTFSGITIDQYPNATGQGGSFIFQNLNNSLIEDVIFTQHGDMNEAFTFYYVNNVLIDNITINTTEMGYALSGMTGRFCCGENITMQNSRLYLNFPFNIYGVLHKSNNITLDNLYEVSPSGILTKNIHDTDNIVVNNSIFLNINFDVDGIKYASPPQILPLKNFTFENSILNEEIYLHDIDNGLVYLNNITVENSSDRGIEVSNVTNALFNNIILNDNSNTALYMGGEAYNSVFNNIEIRTGTDVEQGIGSTGYHNYFSNVTIDMTNGHATLGYGIIETGNHTIYRNITVYNATRYAIFTDVVTNLTVENFVSYSSGVSSFYGQDSKDIFINGFDAYDTTNYGIYLNRINDTTVEQASIDNSGSYGIYLRDDININLSNSNINNSGSYGLYLRSSINLDVDNVDINNSGSYGIYPYRTDRSTFKNLNVENGGSIGVFNRNCEENIFENIVVRNSNNEDFLNSVANENECNHILINVNGTGDKPIMYYNYSANLQNWNNNFSQISLCNADNSVLTNIYRQGLGNNKIRIYYSDNVDITNHTLDNAYGGASFYYSSGNIKNSTYSSVSASGIISYYSDVEVDNDYINNTGWGLYVLGGNVTGNNVEVYNTNDGLLLWDGSVNLENSYIEGNDSIDVDSYSANNVIDLYNSETNGLINMYCYSLPCYETTINLYNTTFSSYSVTNSTLNIYWALDVTNTLGANVVITNITGNQVSSFSDSKRVWLRKYFVSPVNTRTNSTPHNITASRNGYETNITEINMDINRLFTVFLTQAHVPIIDQMPRITGTLAVTVSFGIIGIFTLLFLFFVVLPEEAFKDPRNLVYILIALAVIFSALATVFIGITT